MLGSYLVADELYKLSCILALNPSQSTFRKRLVRLRLIVLVALVLPAVACISPKRTPNIERIFADARLRKGKRPIIVIPGILGSQLINSRTGETVWPSVLRSEGDGSSLPMSPDLAANRDAVVPGKIIETLRLARILPEVYVYRDLLQALRNSAGYRESDWNNPSPDGDRDSFYIFPYDWRRDNVENARELVRRIESLKQKLNSPDLRFNILAHSMGGLIARYAAMYGDADIPDGDTPLTPTWAGAAHIQRIIMIGVPNQGAADAFATLLDGYSITEGLRRRIPLLNKLTRKDAITCPALFQLLPHGNSAKFLDEELKPLDLDLYDPRVWRLYGWSAINDTAYRQRYGNDKAGALASLDAYFAAVLHRAKRFHQALDAISGLDLPITLLALGGDCEETLSAPVILRDHKRDRWVTLIRPREFRTASGRKITKREATEAMYAPGDGRVTRRSLLGQDLGSSAAGHAESPLKLAYAVFGCDLHGQLQRNKNFQDNALTALLSEATK
jgi:pimeloyl-ACP methyl ester carboxylesterase